MDSRAIRDGAVLLGVAAGLSLTLATERIHPLGVVWPAIVLGFLGAGAALLVICGVLSRRLEPPGTPASGGTAMAALFVLLTLVYVAAIEWVGFLGATIAYALASQWVLTRRPRPMYLVLGGLVAVSVFVLFAWGLGVPLPAGRLLTPGV